MHYGFIGRIAFGYVALGGASGLPLLLPDDVGLWFAYTLPVAFLALQTLPSASLARRLRSGWARGTALHAGSAHGLGVLVGIAAFGIVASLQPDPPGMNLGHLWGEPDPIVALQVVWGAGVYAAFSAAWAVLAGAVARAVFGLAEPLPSDFTRLTIRRAQIF